MGKRRYTKKDYVYFGWDLKTKRMLLESGNDPVVNRLFPSVEDIAEFINAGEDGLNMLSMIYPADFDAILKTISFWKSFEFKYSKSQWLWLTPSGEFAWQRGVVL